MSCTRVSEEEWLFVLPKLSRIHSEVLVLLSVSKLMLSVQTSDLWRAALGKKQGRTLFLTTLKLWLEVFCLFAKLSEK